MPELSVTTVQQVSTLIDCLVDALPKSMLFGSTHAEVVPMSLHTSVSAVKQHRLVALVEARVLALVDQVPTNRIAGMSS